MSGLSSWINKRQPKGTWPEWLLRHSVGRPEANGSFLIRTKVGKQDAQARVHVGAMVFERNGVAYTCAAGAARAVVAEMEDAERTFPRVGPAQSAPPRADKVVATSLNVVTTRSAQKTAIPAAKIAPTSPPKPGSPWPKMIGMPPSIENRSPSELRIDDTYQRSIDTGPSQALIRKIARGWDWRMCLPLVVSKRDDGSLYVIDGQHRLAAAQLRSDVPFLPCCVSVYGSVEDEAAMFVAMNRTRRAINRLDDFHAAQAGGNEEALAVAEMIRSVGFTVSRKTGSASWTPGEVAFTSAIAKAYRKHGPDLPRRVLTMMAEAFAGQRLTAGSSIFTACCRLIITPPAGFNPELLAKGIAVFDMKGWSSFLQGSKGGDERTQRLRTMLLEACDDVAKAAA